MTTQEFNEIIDFAIDRERDAVKFYHDLQQEARFLDQKNMLEDLEKMEMGHIIAIENIRRKGVTETDIKHVPNLKISEYLTHDADKLEMTYQNILIKAMKREEASVKLYTEMSLKFPDSELAVVFKRLASEEAQHKLIFEQRYDDWISSNN